MILTDSVLRSLQNCAEQAALAAGRFIQRNVGTAIMVETKVGAGSSHASSLVTEIDRLSQQMILDILLPTCAQYELALLTEESPDDCQRLERDYFWCIDPLDGTLPFTEGVHGYSVSIGLVSRAGIPLIGVIYDPFADKLYSAIRGQGCRLNNEPFQYNDQHQSSRFTLYVDRSFAKKEYCERARTAMYQVASQRGCTEHAQVSQAGAALHACWVMEHPLSAYIKLPQREDGGGSLWDFAASACIFAEAGCWVSDIHGQPLDLNRPDSCFMNHRGIIYASDARLATMLIAALADEVSRIRM